MVDATVQCRRARGGNRGSFGVWRQTLRPSYT
jgi:hypothetical protein